MSRDGVDLPIWARPEPQARQPRFNRERIAAVALEIADTEGFAAVSMRHVAARLGTGAMTLYNYVRTKDELVTLMHDALLAETLRPADAPAADWPDVLADIAQRTRAMLVRHPWAVLSLGVAQLGPNALRHVEQSLAALDQAGLPPSAGLELLALVNDYVHGNVLRAEQARRQLDAARADPERVSALVEFGVAQLRTGEYPLLARLMADRDPQHMLDDGAGPPLDPAGLAAEFERGLHTLLTGAAHRLGLPAPAQRKP